MLVAFAILVAMLFSFAELKPMKSHLRIPRRNSVLYGNENYSPACPCATGQIPLLIPNPYNCRSLFVCSNGKAREYFCPEGKVFVPERQMCAKGSCKTGSKKEWPAYVPCPEDGSELYFKHEEKCNMFYQCDNGIAVPKSCVKGTFWNEKITGCDWPWEVDCESRTFVPRPSEKDKLVGKQKR